MEYLLLGKGWQSLANEVEGLQDRTALDILLSRPGLLAGTRAYVAQRRAAASSPGAEAGEAAQVGEDEAFEGPLLAVRRAMRQVETEDFVAGDAQLFRAIDLAS